MSAKEVLIQSIVENMIFVSPKCGDISQAKCGDIQAKCGDVSQAKCGDVSQD
jgi:hypothetical protein